MFEESTSRNGLIAFFGDFWSLIKTYPGIALLWGGTAPFWLYLLFVYGIGKSAFPLHAYFLTTLFFVENPYRNERRNFKELWFWKAILCCVPFHVAVLAALFYWDRTIPVTTGYSWHFRAVVGAAPDIVTLGIIFDRFRPEVTGTAVHKKPFFREREIFPPQQK